MIKLLCIDASGVGSRYLKKGTTYTLREHIPACCSHNGPWVTVEEIFAVDPLVKDLECPHCGQDFDFLTHIAWFPRRFVQLNDPESIKLSEEKEKEHVL